MKERMLLGMEPILQKGRQQVKRILLYKLEDFFIEVFYDFKNNRIVIVRPFNSTDLLEPYLEKIDISDIETSS